jgi:small subunit ribosomal protein S2
MNRIPGAIFIVDINKEHIAVAEAQKLNIPTFAMVDTNSNPNEVDFPIPSNDDASKSIKAMLEYVTAGIREGLESRKQDGEVLKTEEAVGE